MKVRFPIRFSEAYRLEDVLDEFLKAFHSRQLNYLASDLLDKGYEPQDILDAVNRAMKICRNANKRVEEHFMPIYSGRDGTIIRDCKLSLLGYRLVMLNANPNNPATARFQLKMLAQAGGV